MLKSKQIKKKFKALDKDAKFDKKKEEEEEEEG